MAPFSRNTLSTCVRPPGPPWRPELWLLAPLLGLCCLAPLTAQEDESADAGETAETATSAEESPTAEENPVALDEIVVSASYSLNRENPADSIALSREQILELPTFGDDLFRAISLVPGTSGNDISSAFSVRGAPYEEVLVRLDGVELFEPFHLKDFSGVLSVVDPQLVDGVEIYPGAFPAAFGDRGAAVVDLTTRTPSSTQTRTGVSLSSLYFTRGNRFGRDDRGSALTSVRRVPALQPIFGTTALTATELFVVLLVTPVPFIAVEIEKWIARRREPTAEAVATV